VRLHWGKTFVLGLGFLAISAATSLYDSYMGKFFEGFLGAGVLVGMIMGIDNFLGMTLQPYIGARSDRTVTRFGRRRPYLLIGMPIAALSLAAIPFAREHGFLPLLVVTIILNIAMSLFRSPTVALMPDITPAPLRSIANGVINLMGGIGAAIMLFAGASLYAKSPRYPFIVAGAVMGLIFLVFWFFIREPAITQPADPSEDAPSGLLKALRHVITNPDRNTLVFFTALFAWFVGYQAINTWFTLYGEQILNVPLPKASATLVAFVGTFVVFAVPAGYLGTRFGKRLTICVGLGGLSLSFMLMHFLTALPQITIALVACGFFWALVNINSYPIVVSLAPPSQAGTYTGLYYIFSGLAGMSSPVIAGALFDLVGSKRPLFLFSAAAMAVSLVLLLTVKDVNQKAVPSAAAAS
jgi:maltose/moltooligosaccharide transporter